MSDDSFDRREVLSAGGARLQPLDAVAHLLHRLRLAAQLSAQRAQLPDTLWQQIDRGERRGDAAQHAAAQSPQDRAG